SLVFTSTITFIPLRTRRSIPNY
ncbi:hypothetical protein ABKN59_010967, partial [Abortiporus biennis]